MGKTTTIDHTSADTSECISLGFEVAFAVWCVKSGLKLCTRPHNTTDFQDDLWRFHFSSKEISSRSVLDHYGASFSALPKDLKLWVLRHRLEERAVSRF